MGSVAQNTQEVAAEGEEQLDARLAELLHTMHRRHLSGQDTSRQDGHRAPHISSTAM